MHALILRLIALAALLLLPLGMAAPSAAAPAPAHHATAAAMASSQHCPDADSETDVAGGFEQCNMGCASALAALDGPVSGALTIPSVPQDFALDAILASLALETATPPPKPF